MTAPTPGDLEKAREDALAIVCFKHTMKRHRYVTFWRPDNAGYCWPLSWAGRYTPEAVRENRSYYNGGDDNIAVPFSALERFLVDPAPGQIDGDAGPVVCNTPEILSALRALRFEPEAIRKESQ